MEHSSFIIIFRPHLKLTEGSSLATLQCTANFGTEKTNDQEIKIPKRIPRGPTDILQVCRYLLVLSQL